MSKRTNEKNHTILRLNQSKFFSNPMERDASDDIIWNIPISIVTKSTYPEIHSKLLMESESIEIDIGVLSDHDWILLNSDNIGFYRTCYSKEIFQDLITNFASSDPCDFGSPLDRFGLINDAFAFVITLIKH